MTRKKSALKSIKPNTWASAGVAINTNPGEKPTRYQHREHWSRENRVNRREPITNAGMENGSQAYWAKHNACTNTPPRGA